MTGESEPNRLVRNAEAGDLIELFLVCAIASILVIRAFLHLTGYPQVGGESLHIAHMLWGGLFMMAALFRGFLFLNRSQAPLVAFLGGVGFGTFIDELGKFITHDNDYFFQPTIALLYVLFVALFLILRGVRRRTVISGRDAWANALDVLRDSLGEPPSEQKRDRALAWLESGKGFPLAEEVRAYLAALEPRPERRRRLYSRLRDALGLWYERIALSPWFSRCLVGLFVVLGVSDLAYVFGVFVGGPSVRHPVGEWTLAAGVQGASSVLSNLFVLVGVWALRTSRLRALEWWERAMLVLIFVTQVFRFYDRELAAIGGLTVNLLVYAALRLVIEQEKAHAVRAA